MWLTVGHRLLPSEPETFCPTPTLSRQTFRVQDAGAPMRRAPPGRSSGCSRLKLPLVPNGGGPPLQSGTPGVYDVSFERPWTATSAWMLDVCRPRPPRAVRTPSRFRPSAIILSVLPVARSRTIRSMISWEVHDAGGVRPVRRLRILSSISTRSRTATARSSRPASTPDAYQSAGQLLLARCACRRFRRRRGRRRPWQRPPSCSARPGAGRRSRGACGPSPRIGRDRERSAGCSHRWPPGAGAPIVAASGSVRREAPDRVDHAARPDADVPAQASTFSRSEKSGLPSLRKSRRRRSVRPSGVIGTSTWSFTPIATNAEPSGVLAHASGLHRSA